MNTTKEKQRLVDALVETAKLGRRERKLQKVKRVEREAHVEIADSIKEFCSMVNSKIAADRGVTFSTKIIRRHMGKWAIEIRPVPADPDSRLNFFRATVDFDQDKVVAEFSEYGKRPGAKFLKIRTEEADNGLRLCGDKTVQSKPLEIPGASHQYVLGGRLDSLMIFDDGSFGVVDFKTTHPKDEKIALYSRQLHAYAWCLENPAPEKPSYSPITKMGLLIFEPSAFHQNENNAS